MTEKVEFRVKDSISPFVNCIITRASNDPKGSFNLPLYADGYPGIMFQLSPNGFYRLPKRKQLSELFLYGQTLEPISLDVQGTYRFVVFQLYPFASKYLLGIDPKILNDECYDLLQLSHIDVTSYFDRLTSTISFEQQVETLSHLVEELIQKSEIPLDDRIQQVIHQIIKTKGQVKVKDLREHVHMTERTLERNFLAHVGLTPKQFAKIIQFQYSLNKLNDSNFDKLTHIGLDSGFNDQSHFIRVFKQYTGVTPSYFLKQATTAT